MCLDFFSISSPPQARRSVPLPPVLEPVGDLGEGEAGPLGQRPLLVGVGVPRHHQRRYKAAPKRAGKRDGATTDNDTDTL